MSVSTEIAGGWVLVCVLSAVLVELARQRMLRLSILDIPNDRSSHTTPTPRGGGVVIAGLVLAGLTAAGGLSALPGWQGLAVGGLLIAIISWLDDVRTLSAASRFIVQTVASIVVILAYGAWQVVTLPGLGELALGWVGPALAVVWIVGLTNAYNFMDGIDGIASIQAVIAGCAWLISGMLLDLPVVVWVGGLISASCVGFLVHNWSPARIFMGDVGSAFLGFIFSSLSLVAASLASGPAEGRVPLAALLFVWPFVFDALFTFLRRLRAGEKVFEAHRSHLYQRLVIRGWSHRQVASMYGLLAIASAVCGTAWLTQGAVGAAAVGIVGVPICLLGSQKLTPPVPS